MKIAELTGALLDYWVARTEGFNDADIHWRKDGDFWMEDFSYGYHPSTDWAHGGPIIERQRGTFNLESYPGIAQERYWAHMGDGISRYSMHGPTHLIAAMRALVARKFGAEVTEDPYRE